MIAKAPRAQTGGTSRLLRRRSPTPPAALLTALAVCLLGLTPAAQADFGFQSLGLQFTEADGSPARQAGSHPHAWSTEITFNTTGPPGEEIPDGMPKELRIQLPPGLIGITGQLPRCARAQFFAEACPPGSALGALEADADEVAGSSFPLFNLEPRLGRAAALGSLLAGVPVILDLQISPHPPHNLIASISNITQAAHLYGTRLTVNGLPGGAPFLTLPRSCAPAAARFEALAWNHPGAWVAAPAPLPDLLGCADFPYSPQLSARLSTTGAAAPAGLDLDLSSPLTGYLAPGGPAEAQTETAVLRLPEGVGLNPPLAGGLLACTPAQLAAYSPDPGPAGGCPEAAKIGTATATTPLLERPLEGAVYVAAPHENPFDSLLALYLVLRDPTRGVLVRLPIRVDADPAGGSLTASLAQIPQLPLAHLALRLNSGPRAPLATPQSCGTRAIAYSLTPSSGNPPLTGTEPLTTSSGCETDFAPRLKAGSVSDRAGAAAPFVLELSTSAATSLSAAALTLPPGLAADLGAVATCPEAGAEAAACPPGSRLGFARIALGSGPEPLWVPPGERPDSDVYLAGPYQGAPYSLLVSLAAAAGPYDLGRAVLRAPIRIDPRSAQVSVRLADLPQIRAGVPLRYRRLRLVLDRPGLLRNPTSCEPAAITGSVTSAAGALAPLSERFQLGSCAALPFKPRLDVSLSGALARNGHPTLRAGLTARPGDANISALSLALPPGELLDLRSLPALCARALAPRRCPSSSRLGRLRLQSPLLDRPLQGPVYLRAPAHRYPDLLADLRSGPLRIRLHGRTASSERRLRIAFPSLPDLPLSAARLSLAGGTRGLFANSESLCRKPHRFRVSITAHNQRRLSFRPRLSLHGGC